MSRNHNIQTVSTVSVASAVGTDTALIGAVVPAGMTRYVTFIRANPLAPPNNEGSKVYLCSTALNLATTDALASIAQKMIISIPSALAAGCKNVTIPPSPDTDHPLFTIASGAYLYAHHSDDAAMSSSVGLFVQYYDE